MDNKAYTYDGSVIFHYTNLDGMESIIRNRELWATHIEDLADETEFYYGRDLTVSTMQAASAAEDFAGNQGVIAKWAEATQELPNIGRLIIKMGYEPEEYDKLIDWHVVCFSHREDALPLWRGFGNGCKGYSLGFRYLGTVYDFPGFELPLQRVEYDADRQHDQALEIIRSAIRQTSAPGSNAFSWTIPLGRALYFKDPMFDSEAEWRHISIPKSPEAIRERSLVDCNRKIRYSLLPFEGNYELTRIVCGPLAEHRADKPEGMEYLLRLLSANGYDTSAISIKQSQIRLWR